MRVALTLALAVLGIEAAMAATVASGTKAATSSLQHAPAATGTKQAVDAPASGSSKPAGTTSSTKSSSSATVSSSSAAASSSSLPSTSARTSDTPTSTTHAPPPPSSSPQSPPPAVDSSAHTSSSPAKPASSPPASKSSSSSSSPPSSATTTPALLPSAHNSSSSVLATSNSSTGSATQSAGSTFTPLPPGLLSTASPSIGTNVVPTSSSPAVAGDPTPITDTSGSHVSLLHNKQAAALLFTFIGLIAAVVVFGGAFLLWKRSRNSDTRGTVSDMDEYRGFRRANSSASSARGQQSSNSSGQFTGGARTVEEWHYQPQRMMQSVHAPYMAAALGVGAEYPVHRAIWPDILPSGQPRQQYMLYPDMPPPRSEDPAPPPAAATAYPEAPPLPPFAARPNSPESAYDDESMYSGIQRRPVMLNRRLEPPATQTGMAM